MSATTTVTGTPDKPPIVQAPRRGSLLKRLTMPYRQSHGVQRFMLVGGTLMSLILIVCAGIYTGWIKPHGIYH